MLRSYDEEILDTQQLPEHLAAQAHRGLSATHRVLGNHAAIIRAVKRDDRPVRTVLDIGCGHGELLRKIGKQCKTALVGVDLRPPEPHNQEFPILKLDAVRDTLPQAEVAVSVCMIHHLREEEFVELIRNVGRACRRFVILDLVRHPLPLRMFRTFAPLCLPRVNVLDGAQSIRRSHTPKEFRGLIHDALAGSGGKVEHSLAPFWIRQMADIRF